MSLRSRLSRGLVLPAVSVLTLASAGAVVVSIDAAPRPAESAIQQSEMVRRGYPLRLATHSPTPTRTRRWRTRPPTTPAATATVTATATAPAPTSAAGTTPPPPVSTTSAPTAAPGVGAPAGVPRVGLPAGTVLTPMNGLEINEPGTVIDGADISGAIVVNAPDVVIRRSRVSGTGDTGIYTRRGSLTLEDVTVSGFDNSVGGDNYTATRVEVTAAGHDGFKIGSNVTIQDSWCHDLIVASGAHSDCGQVQSGVENVTIRRNWFDVGPRGNTALFIAPDLGPSSAGPLLVEDNVLGGGNFTLQCVDGAYGRYLIDRITIQGNEFLSNSHYGPIRINVSLVLLSNVHRDSRLPILL